MYNAYLEFCRVNKQCVSNQACFGKVVRNAFPYLQTRRIGGRGNSKYVTYSTVQKFDIMVAYVSSSSFWFVWVEALRPSQQFSVMLGRSHRFLGITSTFWEVNTRIQHGDPIL